MYKTAQEIIEKSENIVIIQAENPDGDSLGSALALEEILGDLNKEVSLYCPVDIPKYLRYIQGWDRVSDDFNTKADLAIIVDTTASALISKVLETPSIKNFLNTHNILIIDHHKTEPDLEFTYELLVEPAIATAALIYQLATKSNWNIGQLAAEDLLIAIMSDSLGYTTQSVDAKTFTISSHLVELGASSYDIEQRRHEYSKKSAEILAYKGRLIERIEYFLDGQLSFIHIPWEEIQSYSDQYNPSMLVLDEMRFVEGVQIGVAIKTYPDGKLTGKIRSNLPIAETVAGFFGGGGHEYAAGFKVYDSLENITKELIDTVDKVLQESQNL